LRLRPDVSSVGCTVQQRTPNGVQVMSNQMTADRAENLGKLAARDGYGMRATGRLIEAHGGDVAAQEIAVRAMIKEAGLMDSAQRNFG